MVQVDLLDEFEKDCKVRGMVPESIRRYLSALRIYREFIESHEDDLLSPDRATLRNFVEYLREERGNNQKTIENNFAAMASFYKYLLYEERITVNPIPEFRERYIRRYKEDRNDSTPKRVLTIEEMSLLVNATTSIRDKAIIILLAKTGIRRGELISIDVGDVDWTLQSLTLKPKAKRSNRVVYFDDECTRALHRWMIQREEMRPKSNALFIGRVGIRLNRQGIYKTIKRWARIAGINDPRSPENDVTVHSFRHWNTTYLIRKGMPRDYVKELRGDARKDAIDIYLHIDTEDLRRRYLACVPQLGV